MSNGRECDKPACRLAGIKFGFPLKLRSGLTGNYHAIPACGRQVPLLIQFTVMCNAIGVYNSNEVKNKRL
jgi:hypothetical protein